MLGGLGGLTAADLPDEEESAAARPSAPSANFDHNEAYYKKLLDVVDLENTGDDDDQSAASGYDTDTSNSSNAPKKIEITDPFVRDLFVVFGKPFAVESSFLTTGAAVSALQGGLMGFACLAFFNIFDFVSRSWLGCWEEGEGTGFNDYLHGMEHGTAPAMLGTGRWWWVGVTTGAGLLIGTIKLIPAVHFPPRPKGLFAEVKGPLKPPHGLCLRWPLTTYTSAELHVEPREAPGLALVSCISLACGEPPLARVRVLGL